MSEVVVLVFRDVVLGLVGAVLGVALHRWRRGGGAVQAARRGTLVGASLAILMMLAVLTVSIRPLSGLSGTVADAAVTTRFVAPLVMGMLAIPLTLQPPARRRDGASVVLARRPLLTLIPRGWLVTLGIVVTLVLAVTLAAGRASNPDAEGRWRNYTVDVGVMSMGTEIYGWYYSVPALVLLAALLLVVVVAVVATARPPLDVDDTADSFTRRWQVRQVLTLATGAVLLHLSRVLASLSGTTAMEGRVATPDGWIVTYGKFAGMEGPLRVVSELADTAGWACWFAVVLTAALTTAPTEMPRLEQVAGEQVR